MKILITALIFILVTIFGGCSGGGGSSDSQNSESHSDLSSSHSVSIINSESTKLTPSISSYNKASSQEDKTAVLPPDVKTDDIPVNNFEYKVNQ